MKDAIMRKEVPMANYEHYSSEEYVSFGEEYRHFEAEVYARPQEIKADI
jgi:hypothetical protein